MDRNYNETDIFCGNQQAMSLKAQVNDTKTDYAKKNQQILDEWHSASLMNDEDKNLPFVSDGLFYRGEIYYNNGIWMRKSANESELWNHAFPRIMLITKDYNDTDGHTADDNLDLRHETLRENSSGRDNILTSQLQFHNNIMFHVFGLGNYKDGHCPTWEALDYDESRRYYESCPLVRINVKKQAGKGNVSDSTIKKYIDRYRPYLNQQISLFDADIIVCYGSVIFDHVINEFFPDIKMSEEDPWVYFSEEQQKVIVNSYHPSVRSSTIKEDNFYTYPINEFEQMMHDHPDFAAKYLHHRC